MNPQDYRNQPGFDQARSPHESPEAWFKNIPGPTVSAANTPPPRRSHKKWFLLGGGIIALVLIGFTVAVNLPALLEKKCLSAADYKEFTNNSLREELSAGDDFYTHLFGFTLRSNEYLPETATDSEKFMRKLGDFYTKHSDQTSIVVTVSSDFNSDTDTKEAAKARIAKLKQALERHGIPAEAFQTKDPTAYTAGGELSADSEELQSAQAYVSIASEAKCRE